MNAIWHKGIVVTVCLSVACVGAEAQTITNGLVGYWPMDNTQGTNLTDHTATGNDGAFVQGSPTWVAGKFGNALYVYNSTLDRASIPHHVSYNTNNTYSISFWFYPVSTYRLHNQFNKGEGKVALGHSAGYADMRWENFGSPWTAGGTGAVRNPSAWHHFVIIYNPYSADVNLAKQVYADGTLVLSNATAGVGSDTALNTSPIGFNAISDSGKCTAGFDDVAIWDRALTTNEVAYLYNGGDGNIVSDLNAAPSAPTNLSASATDAQVILSWSPNTVDPDAYAYSVYRATVSGGAYTQVTNGVTQPAYVDAGLVNGTPYYYVVRSIDLRGAESTNSAEVTATPTPDVTPPAVPSDSTARGGYARIYLAWSANSEVDLAGYNVFASASAGGPFSLAQALVSGTTWTEAGLPNGTSRYYRVSAEDLAGNESEQSPTASATPAAFQDTNPGLVGYWPLDETSGTNLVDASGTGNNGYFVSGSPSWGLPGKLGTALTLDSADSDATVIPHHASYIATDTFSLAFWFQSFVGYRSQGQFSKGPFRMGAVNANAYWSEFGSAPWTATSLGFNYGDGQWHHIVTVFDPSVTYGKQVYVDGSLVASNTAPAGALDTVLNTYPISITGLPNFSNACSNRFDEVAIWNVALSIDQIESLWNEGEGRVVYAPSPAGIFLIIR